jgi:hypothetical protein
MLRKKKSPRLSEQLVTLEMNAQENRLGMSRRAGWELLAISLRRLI